MATQTANLPMPWPIAIQTGTVALAAPAVTDGFGEWLAIVGIDVLGWVALMTVLLLMARDRDRGVL